MGLQKIKSQAQRRDLDAMVKHLESFDLDFKFSAGGWFFEPGGGRFSEGYGTRPLPGELEKKIPVWFERAAPLKRYGLVDLEDHYPNEINQ